MCAALVTIPALHCALLFLSRVRTAMLTRDIDTAILSVRPSVRHAPRNGLTYRHNFFTTR